MRAVKEINPDEIFLDSSNLPNFNRDQFEGRIEKPIARRVAYLAGMFFLLIGIVFISRLWYLQVNKGEFFAGKSLDNSLRHTFVFSDRGVIYDRNNTLLAWNVEDADDRDFSMRRYATTTGFSNLIGYVKYPSKDSAGFYYRADYLGMDGVEKYFDDALKGENGLMITETNVFGKIESQSVLNPPKPGNNLVLSIDSRIQSKLHDIISGLSHEVGFTGGAGAMMDVRTGEIIALVTYPEYDSQTFTDGADSVLIKKYLNDKSNPLLDRATSGLYTPGSIIKPFIALGALNEKIISPDKVIYTTGSLSIPNPYNPGQVTVFRDWKNHGPVDMRKAIEQSSDVYFYQVGGGFGDQLGMGIANIDKYAQLFGFGQEVGADFFGTNKGVVPTPEWKKLNFNGEPWRIGDTYHTVIGQYGFQVTPIQVVRAVAAIANYGTLLQPTILANDPSVLDNAIKIDLPKQYFDVVHEGMRRASITGTAKALNISSVEIAAKTGTAEIGVTKGYVNSWVDGFFPYKDPHYSFVILMEKGSEHNLIGASYVARQLFDWMAEYTPEYLE